MDVDHAGGSPHPVILGQRPSGGRIGALLVRTVFHIHLPLHAGEIDAVEFAVSGRALVGKAFGQGREGDRDLHAPAPVGGCRVVDASVHVHRCAQPVHIVSVETAAAVPVSHGQEQIPDRIQNVHFKFIILLRIGIRIDEDFKIVIMEDDGVPVHDVAPDLIPLDQGAEIEILVVPGHFGPGAETGGGHVRALDIPESVGEGNVFPEGFVQPAVQGEGMRGASADVDGRSEIHGGNRNSDSVHGDYLIL